MSINHNQKIRRALRSGKNSDLRIVTDFGRVDTVETSKDPHHMALNVIRGILRRTSFLSVLIMLVLWRKNST